MNGKQIKYLAGVAELAKLDIEAAAITLRSDSGTITAVYAGMYARGSRSTDSDGVEFETSVNANQFKTLALMFSDEETVKLTPQPSNKGLRIISRGSSALFHQWGEVEDGPIISRKVELGAALPASSLVEEIEAASSFVSDSHLRPALMGIRFEFATDGVLVFMASDGNSAFYLAGTKAKTKGTGAFVVPAEDFLLGARLVADKTVSVYKPQGEQAVIMTSKNASFRSSLIAAPWPELRNIMHSPRAAASFKVESAQLRNLVSGAKALGSGPDIEVSETKGRIMFKTESEAGSFSTTVQGAFEGSMRYGVDSMAKVIKLGPVLDFYVPSKPEQPTVVEAGTRKCWILTRV